MATQQLAEGLASLGRGKDTMLMHVTPKEVAGLQNLAMAHGGSLTINPHTGLPEAGFFDDILGAVAPIGLGMLLGPAGLGMSALGAGFATGLAGFALSGGDLMSGLTAGLGGYGGSSLGKSLGTIGKTATVPQVSTVGINPAASTAGAVGTGAVAGAPVGMANSFNLATNAPIGTIGTTAATNAIPGAAAFEQSMGLSKLYGTGVKSTNLLGNASPYSFGDIGTGAKEVFSDPMKYWKSGDIGWQDALTVASPLMAIKPPQYKIPEDNSYKMKYEGPYSAQDRKPRTPTPEEQAALRAAGSPEYSYFGDTNPYPGFNKAPGYAGGGMTEVYEPQDNTQGPAISQEGYGLGRLQQLAQNGASGFAGGGMIAFDAGGQIPSIPQMGAAPAGIAQLPSNMPMGAPQAGQAPMPQQPQMPQQAAPQAPTPDPLQTMLQNAITDPMGRVVSKAMGGGIHSLAKGGKTLPGGYLDGAGDGMSDSIPATIGSKQPARLADGEFVIPADVVSHLGNGSTKAGAKHLYKMMDKVRSARTGTKKQGRKINPNRFVPA
jgi:hypothetical protein